MIRHAMPALFSALLLAAAPAQAQYQYIHPEAEYTLTLPEAPTVETIWADSKNIPHLPAEELGTGFAGEYGLLKKTDLLTGETFEVRTTFIKAPRTFLLNLTEEAIQGTLKRMFSDTPLENPKFSHSTGADTLKWGTYSGFSLSKANDTLYNVAHYLVGTVGIMTVKITYSVQNPTFGAYYKTLADSIKYTGK